VGRITSFSCAHQVRAGSVGTQLFLIIFVAAIVMGSAASSSMIVRRASTGECVNKIIECRAIFTRLLFGALIDIAAGTFIEWRDE